MPAPAIRSLALDIYAPISPGTYGNKSGVVGQALRVRVSPGASLHLRVGVTDGMVTALVASTRGEVSAAFGNKFAGVLSTAFGEGDASHLDQFFGQQAIAVFIVAGVFLALVPWVRRRMGGVL